MEYASGEPVLLILHDGRVLNILHSCLFFLNTLNREAVL